MNETWTLLSDISLLPLRSPADILLVWAVPLAVAGHNLEEALRLPAWSTAKKERWRRPVDAWTFRFAVTVLTLIAFLLGGLTQAAGWSSFWHYLLAGYALGQGLNILFPHLIVAVAGRTLAPGLLTGIFLVWPAAALLLITSFNTGRLQPERFWPLAVGLTAALVLSIPLLFRLGRQVRAFPAAR